MIMELKVWVDGIQRVVCGATLDTTCQDVVIALAHAMGRTGRFTLIEKWRDVDRPLTPSECPLRVLYKWGEYAAEVRFVLCQADAENQKPQDRDKLKKTGDQTRISHSLLPQQGGDTSVKRSLTFTGVHNYSSGSQNFSLSSSQPTSKFRKTHLGAVPNGDIQSGPSLPQNSRQVPSPRPLGNSNSNGDNNVQINPLVHAATGIINSTGGSMHKGVKASVPSPQPHPVPHPRHKRASPAPLQDNIPSGGVNAPLASSTQPSSALPLSHQRGLHNSRVPPVQPVIPQPHRLPHTRPHPHLNPQSIPSSHQQQQSAGPHLGQKDLHHPDVAPHPAHRDVQHPGVAPQPAQRDVQHPGVAMHPVQRDQQHLGTSAQPAQRDLLGGTVHPAVRGDHSLPHSRESTPPPLPTSLPPDARPFPSHIARLSHDSLDPAPDPKQALAAVEVSLGSANHSRQASLEIEEYDLDRNFPDMSRDSSHGERPSVSLEYRLDDGVTAGSGSGGHMEGEHAKLVRLVNMQQERLKTQESQISMINTEITAMEEREKEYEEQLQAIMEELLLQENRQHELEPQLSDLERVEWENVLDGEKKCELDLSRQIEVCKTKLAELEQKLEQTRKREADLRAEINSEEARLTGERQRLEAEETKAAEEVSKLKEEIQKLQLQSAELEKTILEGQTSLSGIEGDLQASEAQMAEQTAQLEEIEKELKAENMKDFAANPVPKENPQPKDSGETILKILEGRLSPRPPSRGPESPTSPPLMSALAAKTQSGVWV